MPRWRTSSASTLRIAAVLAATLLALLVAAPDRAAAEDLPPIVTNGVVSPGSLPHVGGTVTISVDVTDDVGITTVYADVYAPDGSLQSVQLLASGLTTYSGSVSIGPNFTDEAASHSVWVQASDTNGALTIELIVDVQFDAQPQFDEAPSVSDPSVEPRELPAAGGTVTISVTASDNRGISSAEATIALPDGGSVVVPLEPISFSRFEGTFTAPANSGTTAQQYAIQAIAYDDIGQWASVDAGVVTVAPLQAARPGRRPTRCRLAPPCRRHR
jgi:hypothetical protein